MWLGMGRVCVCGLLGEGKGGCVGEGGGVWLEREGCVGGVCWGGGVWGRGREGVCVLGREGGCV